MPTENTPSRKLAAILFADVVGYTSLMQRDENAARIQLRAFQTNITKEVINHSGEVVNFYGDGALCTFSSPLDAMRCAIALQSEFQSGDVVPVRVGIHMGTVVQEGDKVFGDSVNITSRIESMGIPGAILVSKRVRDELKNQPDILLPSLGQFEFKNVEEPMEIFALANEGFAVPKKDEMKGKFKEKKETSIKKWIIPAMIGLIIVAGMWFWKGQNDSSLNINGGSTLESPRTPLSKEMRQKRVAVMVYENLTMDPSMDAFGKMTSDWITKGLMETKKVNIISGANIQSKLEMLGDGPSAAKEIAEETGVGVILEGRYYLQEGNLIIHTNIIDAEKGQVIHAFDPISGLKDQMLTLLEQLTQDVMGYWAIDGYERFMQNPPNYEAYQTYKQAELIFYTDPEKSEELLKSAIELDSTFYIPMLKLMPLYANMDRMDLYDDVVEFLRPKESNFTEWEKLRLGSMIARFECDYEKAAEFAKRRFEMDPSDITASNNSASNYLFNNDPNRALEVLNSMDTKLRDMNIEASTRELWLAISYYLLGNYEKVLDVIDSYPFNSIQGSYANVYLGALIHLEQFDKITRTKAEFLTRDCFSNRGKKVNNGDLLPNICNDLHLVGQDSLARVFGQQLAQWATENNNTWLLALGQYYQGDYSEAINTVDKIDNPFIEQRAYKGMWHAKIGDQENARKQIDIIKQLEENRQITPGRKNYHIAVILTALKEYDDALDFLVQAPNQCYPFFGGIYQMDHRLVALHDDQRYQDLVRPKS